MDMTQQEQWQAFYGALTEQLRESLGSLYGTIYPFKSAELLNWWWGQPNPSGGGEEYNLATYNFLNNRVTVGPTGELDPIGGSLSLDMLTAYRSLTFGLSAADHQKLVNGENQASAQGQAVVTAYQGRFGTITATQMSNAQAKCAVQMATPLDYIIGYMVRYVWAGIPGFQANGTANVGVDPYNTPDLSTKLPFLPPSGMGIMDLVAAYIASTSSINPLKSAVTNAQVMLATLVNNVFVPNAANGGIVLVDPNTGSTANPMGLGWSFPQQTIDLLNSLGLGGSPPQSSIVVKFTASYFSSEQLDVSVNGKGAGTIPILDFLGINLGGKVSYDYNTFLSENDTLEVDVTYPGATPFTFSPAPFNGTSGWYYSSPIQQAVENGVVNSDGTTAETGYAWGSASPYDWSDDSGGGNFGVLKTLIISQMPKVSITYTTSNKSDFYQELTQSADVGVSLFGLNIFSVGESTSWTTDQRSSTNGSFTVTLNPPPEQATGLTSSAWVVGGAAMWPGQGEA